MKRLLAAALLLGAAALPARAEPAASVPPFARAIDAEIQNVEDPFVAIAEAMPEDRFGYSPESLKLPGSDFKGVRTFAAQVRHVAADNFAIWAPIAGKPEPPNLQSPNGPPEMTSRAEILKFLRDSFAFSHEAARNLTSENALQLVEFRGRRVTQLSLVVLALTHVNDHYGQLVEYARMCGVVPPGSRPMKMP
jgi:DinB family protein